MTTECTMTVLNQPAVVSTEPLILSDADDPTDGVTGEISAICGRPPVGMAEDHVVWVDITKEFTDACSQLELGVLVHDANFGLFEGMSAIEMMDPKMDAGMMCNQTKHKVLSLNQAVKTGQVKVENITHEELIGIVDESFACLVTWLEGHSLAQTVFINLYLHDTSVIKDRALKAFSTCFLKLVDYIRDRINRAGVFEESKPHVTIAMAEKLECDVACVVQEDFQSLTYGFRMAGDESDSSVISAVKEVEDELMKTIKTTRARTGSERDSATQLEHELCVAVQSRLRFTRLFLLAILAFGKEKLSGFEESSKLLNQMKEQLELIKKSSSLGMVPSPADINEGNGFIMGFEPMINQRLLPPTFPRYAKIRSRVETMEYVNSLVSRLHKITGVNQLDDNLHSVLDFFVEFSRQSPCILSRSLLQLLYLPPASRNFGSRLMVDVLKDTLRSFCAPPVLMPKSVLSSNAAAKECIDLFTTHAIRPMLMLFQITGHNRARQRDKWARLLEELAVLHEEAERADAFLHGLMLKIDPNWHYHACLGTWTLYHTLHTMIRHTLAGFELELYLPHEYQYIFWYLCDGSYNWLMSALSRADSFLLEYENMFKEKTAKAAKKNKKKKKIPSVHSNELAVTQSLHSLCAGYYKTMIGLTMDGRIQAPKYDFDCEEYRYNHRFAQFSCLATPPLMSYMQYKEMTDISRYEPALESTSLYIAAGKNFQQSRTFLEEIVNPSDEVQTLLKIAKTNFVVVSILSKGHQREAKTPLKFDFSQHKLFPVIKLA